jgi:hypothetical protein
MKFIVIKFSALLFFVTLITNAQIVPNISYNSGTQIYNVNSTISPLVITNIGGAVSPSSMVTTLAGSFQGSTDETGTAAQFNNPNRFALDSNGNQCVADLGGN